MSALQENEFWQDITLEQLEELRLRVRELVGFLDKKKRKIIYTDFQDEVVGVSEPQPVYVPKMTGAQYEKKVKEFLKNHQDHLVIHRLRTNKPLTETDLKGLEQTLIEMGAGEGEVLLSGLLERSGAPSLIHFVRSLVGMDRATAQGVFSQFLNNHHLNSAQMRFVEMVIEQLTARGVMEASALYDPPFSSIHAGGPDELFAGKQNVIEGIFAVLQEFDLEQTARVG